MKSRSSNRVSTRDVKFCDLFTKVSRRDPRERGKQDSATRDASRKQPRNASHEPIRSLARTWTCQDTDSCGIACSYREMRTFQRIIPVH